MDNWIRSQTLESPLVIQAYATELCAKRGEKQGLNRGGIRQLEKTSNRSLNLFGQFHTGEHIREHIWRGGNNLNQESWRWCQSDVIPVHSLLLEGHNAAHSVGVMFGQGVSIPVPPYQTFIKRISNQTFTTQRAQNEAFILPIGADPSSRHSDNMEQGNRGETVHYGR